MTYREEIQKMISDLQAVYDRANFVRDKTSVEEQEVFNAVRQMLPHVWAPLEKLDMKITGNWANREV